MNILHIESSPNWGGQEYCTCLEINWLNAHGHRAWLMCDPATDVYSKARALDTDVIAESLQHRFNPAASFRIRRFCRKNKVDVISAYSSKDHWLAFPSYLLGVPLVRSRCITNPIGSAARAFIYKYGCSHIVAVAGIIRDQLIRDNGIPAQKISVVPSSVDLHRFSPSIDSTHFRQELGLGPETPLIVNIGMIRSDKGQLRLVKAAHLVLREFPETRFVFVGKGTASGRQEGRLRQAINDLGLSEHVSMLGYRWDTPEILSAATMVVIASLGTEASPVVLREAFATGRPLVATRVGDIPEVIADGENGLLVSPNDIEGLAGAISRLLRDKELARRLGENALGYAREHFDFEKMMEAKLAIDGEAVRDRK